MTNSGASTKPKLVLCAATVLKADFTTRVAAAQNAGYDAITISPLNYLNARGREKLSIADMQNILKDHAIEVVTIDPMLDWSGREESAEEQLVYEAAEAVGASSINTAPAFVPTMKIGEFTDVLSGVCERAARHGLYVDLELLPWSIVSDYPTAFKIISSCGQPNAYITFDCLHFFRSGGTPELLQSFDDEALARISNVQLCDITSEPQRQARWENINDRGYLFTPVTGRGRHPHNRDSPGPGPARLHAHVGPGSLFAGNESAFC